ncbi:MAG: nitrite/sulfite reductase [Proteobacteria bacterium]|nr:nitrite/sulfite reductase [Pseudomonadota bacterium]MBS0492990.1 nitrite/sulfite reductase [Pseudomonadota bacterium]
MYQYTDFDKQFVKLRAQQFRDQLERWERGEMTDDQLLPLRLQNGWYIQRYAPMARIAVPYGEVSSLQLRTLAHIAREYDRPEPELLAQAQATQDALEASQPGATLLAPQLRYGYGHFTTRTNCQFNWIPLSKAADVMDLLASVSMHGIQTSGNDIRNITCDAWEGIAEDGIVDCRPFAEITRQWSSLHPEFSYLPRKFKIAFNGAKEDRAAIGWYDIGLQALKNEAGEVGFTVLVGGGMGRTPIIGSVVREFLPWAELLNYIEAIIRVYNGYGRRDNKWKARIKILVKSEGQAFIDAVEKEYAAIVELDGAPHRITQAEFDRVASHFVIPELKAANLESKVDPKGQLYQRWIAQNVRGHQLPGMKTVTLSFKRAGFAPGDADAATMEALAELAEKFSAAEARLTHEQNLLLPWVFESDLPALYEAARKLGLATPNIGLLTDMIACPGGDFCSLANARSLHIAHAVTERYQDLDELFDIGPIDLHMSGCINSCGHHHSGHIGILGVDKDGKEWYQITLGGADGTALSGPSIGGKVVGPAFTAAEVPDVIEALLDSYRAQRLPEEHFIDTLRRAGHEAFKAAANAARHPRLEESHA